MYAHRGIYTNERDENTLRAFRVALERMDGFECDVRLSRDGVPVIVHDASLLRTHGIHRRVRDMTADELQKMQVPRVEDVVCLLKDTSSTVVFDIKVSPFYCIHTILALFPSAGVRPKLVFLVWAKVRAPLPPSCCTVLRAVGTTFRRHEHVDGIACKYDGTKKNIRCIEDCLRRGMHVNLFPSDPQHMLEAVDFFKRWAPMCSVTLSIS